MPLAMPNTYSSMPGVEIVGLWNEDPEIGGQMAARFGLTYFDSPQETHRCPTWTAL